MPGKMQRGRTWCKRLKGSKNAAGNLPNREKAARGQGEEAARCSTAILRGRRARARRGHAASRRRWRGVRKSFLRECRPPTSLFHAAGFCRAGRRNSRPCSRNRAKKAPAGFGAARRTARRRGAGAPPRRPRSRGDLPRDPFFPAHQESPNSRPPWNTRKDIAHARHSSNAMTASVRRRLFNSCRRADTAAMHGVYSSTNTR